MKPKEGCCGCGETKYKVLKVFGSGLFPRCSHQEWSEVEHGDCWCEPFCLHVTEERLEE